jgi:CRP/FNR family transcriptional regulator
MQVDWLDQLERTELHELDRNSARRRYDRGQLIFAPTAAPRSVFFLRHGAVRVYRTVPPGGEATLGYVRPGEVCGELHLFEGGPRQSYARAVRASSVLEVGNATFDALLTRHPSILAEVSRQLGRRLKRLENRCEDLVLRDTCGRVGRLLLELAEQFGRPTPDGVAIEIAVDQRELATTVGATRQSVNFCLQELRGKRLIALARGRVTVLQPQRLKLGCEGPGAPVR